MSDIFFTIHDNLPREAPGSPACTRRALASVTRLGQSSRILDVGCGPGQQTIALAHGCRGRIVAIDLHTSYLRELIRRAVETGVADRVRPVRATMTRLPFADGAFDVIWCEGAIYIIGFERGLVEWRRLLRPHGWAAISELCWLVDDPPAEPRTFWGRHYPAMTTIDRNAATAAACGYDVVETFALPESAWWNDYYGPLERRLAALGDAANDEDRAVIAATREQIDVYRRFSASFGYVFFVLRRR